MPIAAPLPDGPFTAGAGTPGPDVADLVAYLTQKGNATDAELLASAASSASSIYATQTALNTKVTGTTLFPLGSAENPVTDVAAARPGGIPVVWWRTATTPPNAAVGDWVFLPDAGTTEPPITGIYVQLWDETNGTGVAGWTAKLNASSVVRSTDAAKTGGGSVGAGSLQWAATAASESSVQTPTFAVTASTQYTYKATFYNGDSVARTFKLSVDFFDPTVYLSTGNSAQSSSVLPGAKIEMIYTFTTTAATTRLRPIAVAPLGTAAATFNVSRLSIALG